MCDDDNDNDECHKYLYEILDTSHVTIMNSPGEGVASGQSNLIVGAGTQALPTPTVEYVSESGESGRLLSGRRRHKKTWY